MSAPDPTWITREIWDALVNRAADLVQQVDALQAENARLRAELSQIKASYKVANKPWAI